MSSTCPALNGVQVIIFVILSIRRHGNGKYQDTEEVFEGMWKHDAKEGYGTSNQSLAVAIKVSGNMEPKMATESDCIPTGENGNP